jgi:hypothetical protein
MKSLILMIMTMTTISSQAIAASYSKEQLCGRVEQIAQSLLSISSVQLQEEFLGRMSYAAALPVVQSNKKLAEKMGWDALAIYGDTIISQVGELQDPLYVTIEGLNRIQTSFAATNAGLLPLIIEQARSFASIGSNLRILIRSTCGIQKQVQTSHEQNVLTTEVI